MVRHHIPYDTAVYAVKVNGIGVNLVIAYERAVLHASLAVLDVNQVTRNTAVYYAVCKRHVAVTGSDGIAGDISYVQMVKHQLLTVVGRYGCHAVVQTRSLTGISHGCIAER